MLVLAAKEWAVGAGAAQSSFLGRVIRIVHRLLNRRPNLLHSGLVFLSASTEYPGLDPLAPRFSSQFDIQRRGRNWSAGKWGVGLFVWDFWKLDWKITIGALLMEAEAA